MRISTSHYDFWIEDLTKYFIQNNNSGTPSYSLGDPIQIGGSISYALYSIKNSIETLLEEYTITAGDNEQLGITDEGIYKLYINDGSPKSEIPSYIIKHFPTLKQGIIDLMKDAICDCAFLDTSCSNGSIPTKTNNYNTQLLLSSQGLHLYSLLSQDFIRDYRECFDITLTDDSKRLIGTLQSYYADILINGNASSRVRLLRLYLAYLYLLVYTIEKDSAAYTEVLTISQDNEVKLVEEMFGIDSMVSCFNELNINYALVIDKLDTCYKTNNFGGCLICENTYDGIYYGVKSEPEFPVESEILSGNKYTESIIDGVIISPNTAIYEFAWIAVPVNKSPILTNWEEVNSFNNRSVIGNQESAEFIILKDETVKVNGINYYLYKYNWSSLFNKTLRLYIS